MVHILLTGFEPFGGDAVNTSAEVVGRVEARWSGAHWLSTAILPVEFGRAADELDALVERLQPDLVISLGEAAGRIGITPERTAFNEIAARIADNAGAQPDGTPVDPSGADALQTLLDVDALVAASLDAGVAASPSDSAGRFVCNELFYREVARQRASVSPVPAGFVHVPAERGDGAAAAADELARGVSAMLAAAADARHAALRDAPLDLDLAARLDDLAARAWPALDTVRLGDWTLRFAGGVTKRANSVLPSGEPGSGLGAAIDAVEQEYRSRGLVPTFQVSRASVPVGLEAALAERGYREDAPTLVLVRDLGDAFDAVETGDAFETRGTADARTDSGAEPGVVSIADAPSDDWLDLWWSVDGRGGAAELELGRRVLLASPALYASIVVSDTVVAVARLAIVDDWGGLFSLAVRGEARRRGYASRITNALLAEGRRHHGVAHAWIQVVEANANARRLYSRLGFRPASRYAYWVAPEV